MKKMKSRGTFFEMSRTPKKYFMNVEKIPVKGDIYFLQIYKRRRLAFYKGESANLPL